MAKEYRYSLVLLDGADQPLAELPLEVDFVPAEEWVWLEGLRQGLLRPGEALAEPEIEPLWDPDEGAPRAAGFRLVLAREEGLPVVSAFGARYFGDAIRQAVERLAGEERRQLPADARYRLTARPRAPENAARPHFEAEAEPRDLDLAAGSLAELTAEASAVGEERQGELPVLLPAAVLEEIATAARAAEGVETGGVLVGRVHRDAESGELLVRVSAQIPARHTEGSAVSLSFKPETWTAVRAALELRDAGETMVGWWHSHPVRVWCRDCPPERRRSCRLARDFLSAHDRALHRAIFPRAFSLALVANDVADGPPTLSLFGWRAGRLEPRGFLVSGTGAGEWAERCAGGAESRPSTAASEGEDEACQAAS